MKKTYSFLVFYLLTVTIAFSQTLKETNAQTPFIQSSMIWSSSVLGEHGGYVVFRKSFNLEKIGSDAQLQIFADSRYLLWINGKYVLRGPCRFNPERPEYDSVDINSYLNTGENVIVVLVHTYGNTINGRIMKHVPGLGVVLTMSGKEILHTDTTWKYNDRTRYLSSPASWGTIPDVIDARIDKGDWISTDFDDSSWKYAYTIEGNQWGKMYPRELPLCKETKLQDLTLLPSHKPLISKLPIELTAGQEILIDYGTMAMAYTAMDLDAEEGSELSMRYALRYKNGKLFEMYGIGNQYTACSGQQSFMTTDQWVSHYMLVRCEKGRVKIQQIRITDRRYPFDCVGKFRCSDTVLTQLWDMAIKTIEVVTDDAYGSDARERNEWLQDPAEPNFLPTEIALAGPRKGGSKVNADPRLLKKLLRDAAMSQLPDGRILATFPTDRGPEDCHYFIDDYACQWVEALKIYIDATNDKQFLKEMWHVLLRQMKWFLIRLTPRGLLLAREYTSFDNPLAYITCEGATINAFFYDALRNADYLGLILGDKTNAAMFKKAADKLQIAYNKNFWNEKDSAFNSAFIGEKVLRPTVQAQLIALYTKIIFEKYKEAAQKWFLANFKNPGMKHVCTNHDVEKMVTMKAGIDMPVEYYWVFSVLYRMDSEKMDQEVIQEMLLRWTSMVLYQKDAGTLSESFPNKKGEGASESCHNYGAVPAYFLSSYVLGVRRIGNTDEKKLLIEPRLGDLSFAEGIVETEFGAVPVSWKKSADGRSLSFSMSVPEGIKAEIHLPRLAKELTLIVNNKVLSKSEVKIEGRWMVVKNVSGECFGSLNKNKN